MAEEALPSPSAGITRRGMERPSMPTPRWSHWALRVVGRAIFGDDLAKAGAVLDAAVPVLNRHTFRRAMSPLAAPASWPTPNNRRAARARQALYAVVDELSASRQRAGADGDDLPRMPFPGHAPDREPASGRVRAAHRGGLSGRVPRRKRATPAAAR
jgi:hypothetical protein